MSHHQPTNKKDSFDGEKSCDNLLKSGDEDNQFFDLQKPKHFEVIIVNEKQSDNTKHFKARWLTWN